LLVKLKQKIHSEFEGKKLLSLLVVTGFAFSGLSGFVLSDGFGMADSIPKTSVMVEKNSIPSFVQQSEVASSTAMIDTTNEVFTDIKFDKNTVPQKDYQLYGNKATLFSEKDSFIREGIKFSNEGSNEILRVMGSGPTNNRAVVQFSQDEIESVSESKQLESATLKLFIISNDGKWENGQHVTIHQLTTEWLEGNESNAPLADFVGIQNGVSWNCSSDGSSCVSKWNGGHYMDTPTDSVFISNHLQDGYWITFDVTEDVNNFLLGSPNHGWIIKKSNEDSSGRINFAARESNSNVPELVMVFSK
jgi:hypothetical protein